MAKRKISKKQRQLKSAQMKQYWANKKKTTSGESKEPDTKVEVKWVLTMLVNNPNDGSVEVEQEYAATDRELLLTMLDHMYGGNLIYEYRLQKI